MKLREKSCALAIALALCATAAVAQDQAQDPSQADSSAPIQPLGVGYKEKPAAAARGVYSPYDPQPYDPSQVSPDQNTLAGAQFFSVGSLEHAHNIFDPAISVSEQGQSLIATANGQPSWYSVTVLGGSVNFSRTWNRYRLTTSYYGGEIYNQGEVPPNSSFHNLSFVQEAEWARWHLILRDDFTASPGAVFTGQGMGGPGLIAQYSSMLNTPISTLAPIFLPAETIDTGNAMRYRNTVLGQAEYSFTRRSAFTVSGSYGFLHFTGAGYFSSRMLNAQAGYDYLLDPSNSIAILGSYGKIDYNGLPDSITTYAAAFAYGRRITGRLAFQADAGAEQVRAMGDAGSFRLWLGAVNSALSYEKRRGGVSLAFSRGLTSGSGVFLGAISNTVSTSGHYRLTRFWTGNLTGGFALNNSLPNGGAPTTQFDTWFVGANLGRRLGSHAHFNFNYGLYRQNSPAVCPVTSCGAAGYHHTVGITANWHLRSAG